MHTGLKMKCSAKNNVNTGLQKLVSDAFYAETCVETA